MDVSAFWLAATRYVSSLSDHFGDHHCRILRPGIAKSPNESCAAEPGMKKFFEESAAFLCSGNSSEPVALIHLIVYREGLGKNQLGDVGAAAGTQDTEKLREDLFPVGIQIEDPVDQSHVHSIVW
jgi:hypothetical protein